jgi:hypothetical protein
MVLAGVVVVGGGGGGGGGGVEQSGVWPVLVHLPLGRWMPMQHRARSDTKHAHGGAQSFSKSDACFVDLRLVVS